MLSNFLIFPVVTERIKVKPALPIPIGTLTTIVKEMIDTPPLVTRKKTKTLLRLSKIVAYLLNFLINDFLRLI